MHNKHHTIMYHNSVFICCDIYYCDINCVLVGYNKSNNRCTLHVLNNKGFWIVYTFVQDNGNKTGGHFAGLSFTPSPAPLPKARQDLGVLLQDDIQDERGPGANV